MFLSQVPHTPGLEVPVIVDLDPQRAKEACRTVGWDAERIAATTKKLEKTALLAEYLKSAQVGEASTAAVFFSGRPFPIWEETTLQVGGSLLWRMVQELSGKNEYELTAAYRKYGDLGAVAAAVLPEVGSSQMARCNSLSASSNF